MKTIEKQFGEQELWNAPGSKLIKAAQGQMPSKQRVVGSNPSRDATKLNRAAVFPCGIISFCAGY